MTKLSCLVDPQVFQNGGLELKYSPVSDALGSKPYFDFDVLMLSIPQMAIEDNAWRDANKVKNALLKKKSIKQEQHKLGSTRNF